MIFFCFFFFFQADDGIRDRDVTGVQTCALPILPLAWGFVILARVPLRARRTTTPRPGRAWARRVYGVGGGAMEPIVGHVPSSRGRQPSPRPVARPSAAPCATGAGRGRAWA